MMYLGFTAWVGWAWAHVTNVLVIVLVPVAYARSMHNVLLICTVYVHEMSDTVPWSVW